MKKLSVLHINKFHYMKGGSEVVYFQTARVLEEHGHESIFFSMHHPENQPCEMSEYFVPYVDFNNLKSKKEIIQGSARILYYFKAKQLISQLLDRHPVDIAHLHNVHHQISPSVLHELKKRDIPIVMTLHDYKMVCTSYNLLVEERPCEVCVRGNYYKAVLHRCVKDSYIKSTLAAAEMYLHHRIFDIYDNVDIFIAPSIFLKEKLIEMGFKKKIIYLPNFIDPEWFSRLSEITSPEREDSKYFVYFGRLTHGKGLITLLEAANLWLQNNSDQSINIKIIGDGVLKEELQALIKETRISNVEFLGFMKGEELFAQIIKSIAVVVPSEWYENNPRAVIESFALSKPVIGSRIAGIPELVNDGVTGLTFETRNSNDLYLKMKRMLEHPDETKKMGNNASAFVKEHLSSERYYKKIMEIYSLAINNKIK